MGTTLQQAGLPPATPSSQWNLEHPGAVAEVHRRFVDAGAEHVLSNTLCSLPGTPRWRDDLNAGVRLARSTDRFVWLCLGPGDGHAEAVETATPDGVLLETFVDASAALEAAAAVRTVWDGPLIVSVVPDEEGRIRGLSAEAFLSRAQELGLSGVGVNCVPAATASRALARLDGPLPLWVRPSDASVEDLVSLVGQATWIGGCCGTGPPSIAGLAAYVGGPRSTT